MDNAARDVGTIAGLKLEFECAGAELMNRRVKVLPWKREIDRRSVDCPLF